MKRIVSFLFLLAHASFLSADQAEKPAAIIADIYNNTKNSINYVITDMHNNTRVYVKLGKEPYILFPEESRVNIMRQGDVLTIHSACGTSNIYDYFKYTPSGNTPQISLIIEENEAYIIPYKPVQENREPNTHE